MTDRKLLRVVIIDDIIEHPNADSLELAIVGGWQVCVKKGEFSKGGKAIYAEVDAMLPVLNDMFSFLAGSSNYEVDGVQYARVKTIKLRKELSQGILFSINGPTHFEDGHDLTTSYKVIKYEAPSERQAGSALGSVKKAKLFPDFIPKTDQERVQNIVRKYECAVIDGEEFEVSYKLDGSSFTAYIRGDKVGVCSRNVELQLEREVWGWKKRITEMWKQFLKHGRYARWQTGIDPEANAFTALFNSENLAEALRLARQYVGGDIAIQGEMVGPGIQGNFEGVDKNKLYVYSVFDIDKGVYFLPDTAQSIVAYAGLTYVPVLEYRTVLPATVGEVIAMADGPSGLNGKYREGLVFKSLRRNFTFKVISNKYLLKEA